MSQYSQHYFDKWRRHPWHGLPPGKNPPQLLTVYVEITPFDSVKYEIDKRSGYLRVDRPSRSSSLPPTIYGFVPRTYCGTRVATFSPETEVGDRDPLDICVLSERLIDRSEVLLDAKVIGGLRTLDHGAADDKIIAVLNEDAVWGDAESISDIPIQIVERLRHYFATYKMRSGEPSPVTVEEIYDAQTAFGIVEAAIQDYDDYFGSER